MLYTQATGLTITDEALAEALDTIESGGDVVSARASWANSALNAAASGDIGTAMIVYRTMLGRWPNAVELKLRRKRSSTVLQEIEFDNWEY